MPTNDALGLYNPWYEGAMRTAFVMDLGPVSIRVISPPYFLATKLVAFDSRGAGDFLSSHDLEDIVALVDGRPDIVADVNNADEDVAHFLCTKFGEMLSNRDFMSALPGHVVDSTRTPVVLDRIRQLAGYPK